MPTFIIYNASRQYLCPTLVEKTTISPVYYLWEFISDSTGLNVYCKATELSTQLQRYNKFEIEETATPTALNGQVNLPEGGYTYKIYEDSSSTNLSPTGLTVVEQGIVKCISTLVTNTEYADAPLTNTQYAG